MTEQTDLLRPAAPRPPQKCMSIKADVSTPCPRTAVASVIVGRSIQRITVPALGVEKWQIKYIKLLVGLERAKGAEARWRAKWQ